MTNTKNQKVELDDCYVLMSSAKISSLQAIAPILEQVNKTGSPLLIVAEDVDQEALATLIVNRLRNVLKITAIKAPGFGDNRKAMLEDMAILTGGTVVSADTGMKLENLTIEDLGMIKRLEQTKDDTVMMIEGGAQAAAIEERCDQLRAMMEDTKSDYEKEKMQERLAKLGGGVAVIKVGGASEVEVNEIKDRLNDALNATKAALEEGIVPGGGTALLYASRQLESLKLDNFDQQVGVDAIRAALLQPCKQIASNAGAESGVVVQTLLKSEGRSLGFNAAKGEYVNMVEAGIIDPTKVVRTALADAASVASLMTTTEAIVAEEVEE